MIAVFGLIPAVRVTAQTFTTLHSFTAGGYVSSGKYTNSDGGYPIAGLILSGNSLYGTTSYGGGSSRGTVFKVNTHGRSFMTLHTFSAPDIFSFTNSDGAFPYAGLILSGNTLYGTAVGGGSSGNGTVFSLSLESVSAPQLSVIPSGANVILTWPTHAPGFTLQSSTNHVSTAAWITVSPGPVLVNGQNAVTDPISGPQKFYRLSQ